MYSKKTLTLLNELLSRHDLRSMFQFIGVAWKSFAVLAAIVGVVGVVRGYSGIEMLWVLMISSLALSGLLLILLRSIRWNLVSWGIRMELDWFVEEPPSLIVGIGPGGAIIAGIIAKQLADRLKKEPLVFVFDRVFEREGKTLAVRLGNTGSINVDINGQPGRVLLVTSEVHNGNTMRLVYDELKEANIEPITFSFLVSPQSTFEVDKFIIESDKRGILPWCDSPNRKKH